MSIFLSGNNVASQPNVIKKITNSKPPTNLSLPVGVDYLLPENGGAAIGSIINIGNASGVLYVVLAGESDLTNQITLLLQENETIPYQIRYISPASTYDGDPLGDSPSNTVAVSVSLSSTSTITAPFYNFSVKAEWYQVFGGATPNQSELTNWLTSMGLNSINIVDFTYVQSTVIGQGGSPIGEISCDLSYNGKAANYYFNDYFYEINGIGINQGDRCDNININSNPNLTVINCYYGSLKTTNLYISDNHSLEYIDGNIFKGSIILNELRISYNNDLKEIINFTSFPDNIIQLNIYANCNYDNNDRPIPNFKFNGNLSNLTQVQNINFSNNGLETFDYNSLPVSSTNYGLNLNGNNLTEFIPVELPNTIYSIDIGNNKISKFKPEMLPNQLNSFYCNNNQIDDITVNFNWDIMCPLLNTGDGIDFGYNYISSFKQPLPSNGVYLNFSYNNLSNWDSIFKYFPSDTIALYLGVNKFTYIPDSMPFNNLVSLYLDYNLITKLPNLNNYTLLQNLNISSNQITGTLVIDKISLQNISFSYNPITAISIPNVMTNLQNFDIGGTAIEVLNNSDFNTKLPNIQNFSIGNNSLLREIICSIPTNQNNVQIYSNEKLTIISPIGGFPNGTSSSHKNISIQYNNSLVTYNNNIPLYCDNFAVSYNPNLVNFTPFGNIPNTIYNLNIAYNKLSNIVLSGNGFPNNFFVNNNNMTTANWNSLNTWATGLSGQSGKTIFGYGNVNQLSGTTFGNTLNSKGISVIG